MEKGYPNTLALVTGASSGIGEALCRELCAKGWTVIGIARSQDKLLALQKELGEHHFYPVSSDVSDRESIKVHSQKLLDQGHCPSLFFLNAGIAGEAAVEDPIKFDLQKHQQIMAVNYFGVLAWLEFWEKPCQANGGANFIVTSSVNAIFAPPTASAYAASKAAISKAFEGLSLTYLNTNLRFSTVYAGPVATAGLKGNLPFIWKPERMAQYMVNRALANKSHSEPSLFYSLIARLLRGMPYTWTMHMLKKLS